MRGRVHLHFRDPGEVVDALQGAGFARAEVRPAHAVAGLTRPARHSIGLRPGGDHMIETTLYSDPACPWAYSESPALRVIEWRYGEQLDWRLVLIGLTEDATSTRPAGIPPCAARSARRSLPPPLWNAVRGRPEGAPECDRPGLPGGDRRPDRSSGKRVAGVPGPPAGQFHHAAGPGRRRSAGARRWTVCPGSTVRRWWWPDRRPRCPRGLPAGQAGEPKRSRAQPPSSRARPGSATAPSASRPRRSPFRATERGWWPGGFSPSTPTTSW